MLSSGLGLKNVGWAMTPLVLASQRASWGHPTIRRRLSRLGFAREHRKVSTACALLAQKIICYPMVVDARCELGASRAPVGANTLTPVQPSLLVMSLLNVLRCGRESVSKKKVTPAFTPTSKNVQQ